MCRHTVHELPHLMLIAACELEAIIITQPTDEGSEGREIHNLSKIMPLTKQHKAPAQLMTAIHGK